ncbi:MAG: efflux RND transporter permease subunit, partial [bacterium]
MASSDSNDYSGPIAWMARHTVAANLLMIVLLVGGYVMIDRIKKEVFPDFSLDVVSVNVVYPGASPEEVENGIVLPVEEAVRGMEGIDEVTSTANEGSGNVRIELTSDADRQKLFQDIEQEINRIRTFPDGAEEPTVKLLSRKNEVLNVGIYGNKDRWTLRKLAEKVRDRLLLRKDIRQVELEEPPEYVMHLEIPQQTLRAHSLSLSDVAQIVSNSSQDIPGGDINTKSGELLLRVQERKVWAEQIRNIPIVSTPSGSRLTLGDLGTVTDGFEESDYLSQYNGKPTMDMKVYRIGDQSPPGVSEAVHEAMQEISKDLPPGVNYRINRDRSEIYYQRLNLLLENSFIGLIIVICVLGLFVEIRLAFWVMMGIPISFMGALLLMPVIGISINMISMFAFLMALGIVVDDAIVVGENIFEHRERGMEPMKASIEGAQDMVKPVTFSIITNCVAFSPMLFIPGMMGKFMWNIPAVVITIFLLSLVEAFLILPAHLAHTARQTTNPVIRWIDRRQEEFASGFRSFVETYYRPFLNRALNYHYLTLVLGVCVLAITVGYVISPRMPITFMPDIPADATQATVKLLPGTPMHRSEAIADKLTRSAQRVIRRNGGD